MSFAPATHADRSARAQPHLQHLQYPPAYQAFDGASNEASAASGGPGMGFFDMANETANMGPYASFYHAQYGAGAAAMTAAAYPSTMCGPAPPPGVAMPLSDSSTSSSHGDTSDADEDAMVDAAMHESGILTSALLSEDHTVLDAALLREMEDLLASSREDATQWNQFHLVSPSLMFPAPGSPWALGGSRAAAAPPLTPLPAAAPSMYQQQARPSHPVSGFLPHGDGWQVPQSSSSTAETEAEDMEMEDDEEVEEPTSRESDVKEMELLTRQLKFLEAQREFLDYKAALASSPNASLTTVEIVDRQRAVLEKRKLVEAQLHREMLTKVAKQQLENLKYMELLLLQSPLNHYRMTLMTPMESYIHLTRDPAERRATLLSMRDEKIDTTRRFIEFQSRNIDLERQFFYLDTFEKFGKFYTVDFSISKFDDASVDEVVGIIYNHFVSTKDMISQILGSVENREYFDGVEWVFLNARFVDRINLPMRRKGDKGFVVQESNTVYYVKKFGESVVMMCDYIDKDELHPYRATGRVRKDKTVGVVVEPHTDAKGKKSVVLKRFSFIKHHFKNIEPTPDLIQAISTKVILWGQAVRFCLSSRAKLEPNPAMHTQLLARSAEVTELSTEDSPW